MFPLAAGITETTQQTQAVEEATTATAEARQDDGVQRLNLVVSARTYRELSELARRRHTSMKEIIRLAIGFIKIVLKADADGYTVAIVNRNGQAVKELVLPS
jgi:hypothetical protein